MNEQDALEKLNQLLAIGHENEWIERKTAKNSFNFGELGKYFSALSNEANLNNKEYGWLIFGVEDDGTIIGTQYRPDPKDLESLKHEISQNLSNNLSFTAIHEIMHPPGKRVLLFQIPAALVGIPTSWKGHFFGRNGESLVALTLDELERIRHQDIEPDWTATICTDATLGDLSPDAINKARGEYEKKNPRLAAEIHNWNDTTFLNKTMALRQGQITRAAILLLGRPEAEVHLSPSVATISWILKDYDGIEQDYEHFGPPWILNVDTVYKKVRNLRYRHMPDGNLFPIEVDQYDEWVFREALHNSIAHQDYALRERISVVEFPNRILFSNAGNFIPQKVENVIQWDAPPARYRNPFLAKVMVNFNMIDTIGSGIKRMFLQQRKRFFPLPDFVLSKNRVSVTIHGRILDARYVEQLSQQAELSLNDVMLLDKIQKEIRIEKKDATHLRSRKLVEGRYPRLHISSQIAKVSNQREKYLHTRGLDEKHYAQLIIDYIQKFGSITRKQTDDLLLSKLPEILTDKQKKNKIHRLLSVVLKNRIVNSGTRGKPKYILSENNDSLS